MRKFTISVAAASAVAALLAAAPASAERNPGAVKNGSQCWNNSRGGNGEFGFWGSCPQPASTTVTTRQRRPVNASR